VKVPTILVLSLNPEQRLIIVVQINTVLQHFGFQEFHFIKEVNQLIDNVMVIIGNHFEQNTNYNAAKIINKLAQSLSIVAQSRATVLFLYF